MTPSEHALRAQEKLSQALESLADDYPAEALMLLGHVEHEARRAQEALHREACAHIRSEAAAMFEHSPPPRPAA